MTLMLMMNSRCLNIWRSSEHHPEEDKYYSITKVTEIIDATSLTKAAMSQYFYQPDLTYCCKKNCRRFSGSSVYKVNFYVSSVSSFCHFSVKYSFKYVEILSEVLTILSFVP